LLCLGLFRDGWHEESRVAGRPTFAAPSNSRLNCMCPRHIGENQWVFIEFISKFVAFSKAPCLQCQPIQPLSDPMPPLTAPRQTKQIYRRDSPNAHLTKEQPDLTVCCAPISSSPGSNVGLTSTKSIATKHPVSWTHSAMKSPSLNVRPPRTGVPVLGAHIGSSASTSKER
jgi:hypothetical protein